MFGDGLTVQPHRFTGLFEDARTIQKAQAQFQLLSAQKDAISLHQAVRWLVTKEEHAGKIIENMSEYMLAQRIKPRALQGHGIIIIEIVDAHHGMALRHQPVSDMHADEPCRTGDQYRHAIFSNRDAFPSLPKREPM